MILDRDPEFIQTITFFYRQELGRDPDPGGLASYLEACRNGLTGTELQQALHDSAEGVAFRTKPVPPPVPELSINHLDFLEHGQRRVLSGCDGFLDFFRYRREGRAALLPLLKESQTLGFTMRRVFMQGSQAQNTLFDLNPNEPGYYADVRPFADLLNSYGIILLATVYVDNQDVRSDLDHWLRIADPLHGSGTIMSGFNQWTKNTSRDAKGNPIITPWDLPDPGMVWSRGSDVEDRTVQPKGASVQEFHPRRDLPASLMDTVASPVYIYQSGVDWERPLIISEPPKMGESGSSPNFADPQTCWEFARIYATECAGAVFHSYEGQRSQLLGPTSTACAEAWQQGMRI